MGTSVKVNRSLGGLLPLCVERGHFTGEGIDVPPDAQRRRTAVDVGPSVWPALPFGQRLNRCVPRLGTCEAGFIQRNSDPVPDQRVLCIVLIPNWLPFAREIHLRRGRRHRRTERHGRDERDEQITHLHDSIPVCGDRGSRPSDCTGRPSRPFQRDSHARARRSVNRHIG